MKIKLILAASWLAFILSQLWQGYYYWNLHMGKGGRLGEKLRPLASRLQEAWVKTFPGLFGVFCFVLFVLAILILVKNVPKLLRKPEDDGHQSPVNIIIPKGYKDPDDDTIPFLGRLA